MFTFKIYVYFKVRNSNVNQPTCNYFKVIIYIMKQFIYTLVLFPKSPQGLETNETQDAVEIW